MRIVPLQKFLATKPIYYKKFDPTRIVKAYKLISNHILHPKRVQLVGTNGKGSTGRAVAHLANFFGLRVGHFTSPHILDFKERFWIDGAFATNEELEVAHEKLFKMLGIKMAESLSYFEYQALLAFVLFEKLDLQVIEAGLGGEFDATSVANYELTVVVPIGFDHSDFLGDTLGQIAKTKLKAMASKALIAKQNSKEVYEVAKNVAKKSGTKLYFYEELKSKNIEQIKEIAKQNGWADYLVENIINATFALDILGIKYNIANLASLQLFGRFYKIMPNVTIDVGHNPLAASAIVGAIEGKVTLIFNILGDKDLTRTLEILKPKIKDVEIIKIETQRATELKEIEHLLESLGLNYSYFNGELDDGKEYLVFGSFYVVEAFLKSIGVDRI